VLEQLVNAISDTSFLIHLATHRITNLSDLETEIGRIEFIVPDIVIQELKHLSEDKEKNKIATVTLDFIKDFKTNSITGKTADLGILDFVEKNGGIVATMDRELKVMIKQVGGSVLSIHNDKIVLEN
jgi:rRNA-processing protein FCF1|tara:strand:- start:4693 stop:5073 length:381 start_codon:yes stop_codon:yes gene_type:complete